VYLATSAPQADSVAALTALYPRQYGNTGRSTVLLLFDTRRLNLSRGFTLTYSRHPFQLGTQRFFFSPPTSPAAGPAILVRSRLSLFYILPHVVS
jgi:hypothetical protein